MKLTTEDVFAIIDETNRLGLNYNSSRYNLSNVAQLCNEWAAMRGEIERLNRILEELDYRPDE